MPKAFNAEEKETIRKNLMTVGLRHFERMGVRAARIDDLCREVGIAKGSFYAFFTSKEDLYLALADAHDERHKVEMIAEIENCAGDGKAAYYAFFDTVMERLETDPLIRIVQDTAELAYILRHAPADYIERNTRRDKEFVAEVADLFRRRYGLGFADADTLENIMNLMVTLSLQRDYLTTVGSYAPTVALLRDMSLTRVLEGAGND